MENNKRFIASTYSIITPKSAEDGDYAENGWKDSAGNRYDVGAANPADIGQPITGEDYDGDVVAEAVAYLKSEGASEPSSYPFNAVTWYSASNEDYRSGSTEETSYHLYGFTAEEEREIYRAITGR